jgi:preprotein translocase subunit YajC|tara:strand:- start:12 stop:212 length:201 start_codon:yes stop_codon:yes gene_type:complete
MTKINRFNRDKDEKIVTKGGIKYRVLDLGGSSIEVRVKSDKELAKDYKAFAKYLSGVDETNTTLPK